MQASAPQKPKLALLLMNAVPAMKSVSNNNKWFCGYAQIRGVFRVGGIGCNLNFLPHEKPTKIKKKERKQQKSSEKLGKKGKYPNLRHFFTPGPLSGSERLMQIGIGIGSYKLIVIILWLCQRLLIIAELCTHFQQEKNKRVYFKKY